MSEHSLPHDRLLTRAEVEVNFGLSRRYLEIAAVRDDDPPRVNIGRSVRYLVADLRQWIEARRVNSTSQEVSQ